MSQLNRNDLEAIAPNTRVYVDWGPQLISKELMITVRSRTFQIKTCVSSINIDSPAAIGNGDTSDNTVTESIERAKPVG